MTIKLHDIKFRKMDKFKYLESIIPENDRCGSEITKFKQNSVGEEKDYCRNTLFRRY